MNNKKMNALTENCKKCNGVRNIIPLETLPKETQKDFKKLQKDIPGVKLVYCKKCEEIAVVSEYTAF